MSDASFADETGAVRLKGKLTQTGGSGIPQGGPLDVDLVLGQAAPAGNPAVLDRGSAGSTGGDARLRGGDGLGGNGGGSAVLTAGAASDGSDGAVFTAAGGTTGLRGLATVRGSAFLFSGLFVEPADVDIPTRGFALWIDATNGAAKLMIKAKQANGTVVAAAIPLAP